MIDYETYIGSPKNAGLRCTFVQLNETLGLKIYANESARDESYRWQKELHRHGLAPAVGEKTDIAAPNGKKLYAHATEVASQIVSIQVAGGNCADAINYQDEFDMLDGDQQMAYFSELKRFHEKMDDLGYMCTDDHPGNFGWIGDRLVLIDCEGMRNEKCAWMADEFPDQLG